MPRDGRVVRARLQHAALELFLDRGFDSTSAALIAERAGVTERTFFRHFADKREVLFDGERELREDFTDAFGQLESALPALPALLAVFHHAVPLLERNRSLAAQRARVIRTAPALLERELAKSAGLIDVLAASLQARGVDAPSAQFAASIAMDVLTIAIRRWNEFDHADLHDVLDTAFEELRTDALTLVPRSSTPRRRDVQHSAAADVDGRAPANDPR